MLSPAIISAGQDKTRHTPPRFHLLIFPTLLLRCCSISSLLTLCQQKHCLQQHFPQTETACACVLRPNRIPLFKTFIVCQQFAWVYGESQEVKYTSSCQDIATDEQTQYVCSSFNCQAMAIDLTSVQHGQAWREEEDPVNQSVIYYSSDEVSEVKIWMLFLQPQSHKVHDWLDFQKKTTIYLHDSHSDPDIYINCFKSLFFLLPGEQKATAANCLEKF